jgi:hypothetical protein
MIGDVDRDLPTLPALPPTTMTFLAWSPSFAQTLW